MRAATVVVVAALLSVVFAQNKCTGYNVTMNPGLQPYTTQAGTPTTTLTQTCPFGYYSDISQGGRCITYRQGVSNYMDAPCYLDSDCGSGLSLGCGANKKCTWSRTRLLDDSCTDNINCRSYTALNGSTIQTYCALKTTNKCSVLTVVTVGVNARCNYTIGNERYMCDDATTCKYYNNQDSQSQAGTYGAGYCTPLRQPGEVCVFTTDITQVKYPNLWCANKLACAGQFPNNRTCVTPRNQNDACYQPGLPYECATGLYCEGVSKTCQPYVGVGTNCTGDFLSSSPSGNNCQMGLRCIVTPGLGYRQCAAAASAGQVCSTSTDITAGNNCTTGLQCITQPVRGLITYMCSAGANGDVCQKYTPGPPTTLIDSCQPGLFCQDQIPANYTCIPKFALGAACNISNQCLDGTSCVNSTCTAFQKEGEVCQELRPVSGDYGLNYLRCNPSLQCSRGICIQNYTKSVGDFCSQDADCENSHCDTALKRCTRRKLCTGNSGGCQCTCSSGADNMGQCIMSTCNKASNALRNCLNPLDYNPFANSSLYIDNYFTPMTTQVIYDSGSSYYTKCSSQWSDWMRCRGLMAKWGAPAVPLGDYLLYDLATISASSTVSVSFVAMIAFVLAIALNL